jgi:DHA1 family multidrug resistance protein-like MFS transporter
MTGGTTSQTPALPATPRTSWLQLGVVSAGSFVTWTGFGAIIPFLPIFLRQEAHSSLIMIGVVASTFYAGTLLLSSPLGWLSDVVGRKPVMIGGTAVYALALLLFTTTTDPYWFVVFRFLAGAGTAAFGPAALAFVADSTTETNRSKGYGLLTTAQFGGLVVGPALAPPLFELAGGGLSGYFAIFYFGAALSALALVALIGFVHEPAAHRERHAQRRADQVARAGDGGRKAIRPPYRLILSPAIVAFLIIAFTSNYAMGAFEVVWSLWLQHLGASLAFISATWVAFSVPMLLSFVGGIVADRYSRFWLFIIGYALSGVAWVYYGVSHNLTLFIVVNVLEGFAIAFSYPAKQALLVQVSPVRWIGTVTGVENTSLQLAGLLGTLTAPPLFGLLSGHVFSLSGLISLAGIAVGAPMLWPTTRRMQAQGLANRAENGGDEAPQPSAAEPPGVARRQ